MDVLVIEVDAVLGDPERMKHPLATSYYNPYYLLHHFTCQRLAAPGEWRDIFATAGYDTIDTELVSPDVDSTGFEIGFLLRSQEAREARLAQ